MSVLCRNIHNDRWSTLVLGGKDKLGRQLVKNFAIGKCSQREHLIWISTILGHKFVSFHITNVTSIKLMLYVQMNRYGGGPPFHLCSVSIKSLTSFYWSSPWPTPPRCCRWRNKNTFLWHSIAASFAVWMLLHHLSVCGHRCHLKISIKLLSDVTSSSHLQQLLCHENGRKW